MNIYVIPSRCDNCGVASRTTIQCSERQWRYGGVMLCNDRAACASRARRNRDEAEKRIAALEKELQAAQTAQKGGESR